MKTNNYTFFKGYQNDAKKRHAFNNLSIKTFGLDFEIWYQSGYWRDKYIPYTLFDGDKAIANVSVNIMDFNTFGEAKRYIQLGTVMTDDAYRKQGLSQLLMKKVMQDWDDRCDFMYLFANSSVLTFYPKFGFTSKKQFQYSKRIISKTTSDIVQLDMDDQKNRDKLYDYAKNTAIFGQLSMKENADLVMFYCISLFKNKVYYIKSLDVIVIAKFEENRLYLYDIFSKADQDLEAVVSSLSNKNIDTIVLGFTPKNTNSYDLSEIDEKENDEVLFVKNDKTSLFDDHKVMFPTLSHA